MTLPLAELHVHLEGTVPPALIQKLADRNGLSVPAGVFASPDRFQWVDFLDFLRTYDLAASVIRTEQDYRDITYEYLIGLRPRGRDLRRADRLARPCGVRSGCPTPTHYAGIAAGIDDARRDGGHRGADAGHGDPQLRRRARRSRSRASCAEDRHPYIVGFNLAGDEAGYPPGQFREAYEIAAGSGLGCTVHAGEHAGAESVREALTLPVTRLSHGVRAVEDPALVQEIVERGIVLEACPTSNIATHVFDSYEDPSTPQTP